ncbi:2-amino-4-hydroxy-6-hydroxymethyldihydropteridine diphosphokinase [Roseovarius pacificus]|uniref:2-amino-4-hydroxy-6- hydroxymethyldihydropteridine diphosphokinase n=1 Tax=Roseovarius pacificus TaxID=337701 RepID=UPI002597DB4D|nr:2-amino-4-hydroxy-6-hydroxymethyldihydropteridine diphosphokinase [Roseovarius pacificus]
MVEKQSPLIAIGGNMPSRAGDPARTLHAALQRLSELGVQVYAVSRFYRTPCFPPGAGPDYVNAAARLAYDGEPEDLLAVLHEVEAFLGRERQRRWGQRTLDLDLIAMGGTVLPDRQTYAEWRDLPLERQMREAPDTLILPHPRMQDRAFVLVPLADIAPGWRHPVSGRTVAQMLADLPDEMRDEVRAL